MKRLIITALIALTITPVFANSSSPKRIYDESSFKGPVKQVINFPRIYQVSEWIKSGKKTENYEFLDYYTDYVEFDKQGRIIEHDACCDPNDYGTYRYDKNHRLVSIVHNEEFGEDSDEFSGWKYTYHPNNMVKTATYYLGGQIESLKYYNLQVYADSIIYIENKQFITVFYPDQKLSRPCHAFGETNDICVQNPYNCAYRIYEIVDYDTPQKEWLSTDRGRYAVRLKYAENDNEFFEYRYDNSIRIQSRTTYSANEICTYVAEGNSVENLSSRSILNKYGDPVKHVRYIENGVEETRYEYTYDKYGNWTSCIVDPMYSRDDVEDEDMLSIHVFIRVFDYYN